MDNIQSSVDQKSGFNNNNVSKNHNNNDDGSNLNDSMKFGFTFGDNSKQEFCKAKSRLD